MYLPIQTSILVDFGREHSVMWHLSDTTLVLEAFGCHTTLKDGRLSMVLLLNNMASLALLFFFFN